MVSTFLYGGLQYAGLPALRRRISRAAVVLCYHNVVPDGTTGGDPGLHLPVSEFRWQLDWIEAHYRVVALGELAERLRSGRSVRGLAVLTFDDAYTGAFQQAWPLLRARGLPATMFVPTRFVGVRAPFWWDHPIVSAYSTEGRRTLWLERLRGDGALIGAVLAEAEPVIVPAACRPADWAAVRRAHFEGLDVGLHSATHRNLVTLDARELAADIGECARTLWDRCGVDADAFAYPYGLHDAHVREAVRVAGLTTAVTLDFGLADLRADPLALPRVNVPGSIARPAFCSWSAGLRMPSAA